jgi:spore coat protein CotH
MVANKHIDKIIISVMAAAALLCLIAVGCSGKLTELAGGTTVAMEYPEKLFNTDNVIEINITMDDDEWNKMLENALTEEYYVCDIEICGEKFKSVGIRPKGNTSLSSIAMNPDTDRYSLKLEFDHFMEGQSCFGLDKLILNNNYADATNMKEAVIYDMFNYIGATSSLYNYAKVSLNGEYKGVYLALEGVEKSFMLRNYGTQDGKLYKPESMGMGGGNSKKSSGNKQGGGMPSPPGGGEMPGMGDFDPANMPDMGDFDPENIPDMGDFDPANMPDMGDFDPGNMPGMGDFNPGDMPDDTEENNADSESKKSGVEGGQAPGEGGPGKGGFSMGSGGANLNYSDDDLDSYSTIWDGEITETADADHRRVVNALKNISEGNEIEKYLDVDNILKYMAVHTFSVNMDSLSGSMAHNYYLYEYNGQLNIFPWDYNLSLGGMSMGRGNSSGASGMINDAIDTPFDSTHFFDTLLENEEYLERYHEYLRQLSEEYVEGGKFDEVYNRIRSQIDKLVETDPTAFYSYDEYDAAAKMLYKSVILRAESIIGQLNGIIPSTDEGQKEDSSALIDASEIDVSVMGTFNMGGGPGGGDDNDEEESQLNNAVKRPKRERDAEKDAERRQRRPGNQMPEGFNPMGQGNTSQTDIKSLAEYGIYLAILIAAMLFAKALGRRRWVRTARKKKGA